jgi:acetylornithine deacetylase/succinyl-diaminopimelate desuccinylase-like protein
MTAFAHRADPRRLEASLAEFVDIPSVNPSMPGGTGEQACGSAVHSYLQSVGLRPLFQQAGAGRSNVLAMVPGRAGSPLLVFEAHMDTVATSGHSTAEARVKDGRLFGRGACDTKASLAAMVEAARLLKELDESEHTGVLLAATVDEEYLSIGAKRFVEDRASWFGAIVGEPTGLEVVVAHRGVLRFRLHVAGVAAHTSRPQLGKNAVHGMATAISRLNDSLAPVLEQHAHPLIPAPPFHVTGIVGGDGLNTIPGECIATAERRLNPGETERSAISEIDSVLENCRRDGIDVTREDPFIVVQPFEIQPGHPLAATLVQARSAVLGEFAPPIGVPYGTDASIFAGAQVPTVVFGPGSIDQAHTDDEWVDLDEVVQAADVLVEAAVLCASVG